MTTRRVAPPPPAYLVLHHGGRWRDIVQLRVGALTIGRDAGSDVSLASESVSRRHARIVAVAVPGGGAGWAVEDLDSRHGVRVDDRRIDRRTVLQPGNRIGIGPYELLFTESLQSIGPAADVVDVDGDSIEASATIDPAEWQSPGHATDAAADWLSLAVRLGGIGSSAEALSVWMVQLGQVLPPASLGVYTWTGSQTPADLPPPAAVSQAKGFRYRRPPAALIEMTCRPGGTAVLARQIQSSPLLASPDTAGNIAALCVIAVPIVPPGGATAIGLLHAVTAAGQRSLTQTDLNTATMAAAVLGGWLATHTSSEKMSNDLMSIQRDNQTLRTQLAERDLLIRRPEGLKHQADDQPLLTLAEAEAAHIALVMKQTGGHKSKAATILGIPRSTLDRKLDRYQIATPL